MGFGFGTYPDPCTRCGTGTVQWSWFSDHYSSGGGSSCKNCGASNFTQDEIKWMRGVDAEIRSIERTIAYKEENLWYQVNTRPQEIADLEQERLDAIAELQGLINKYREKLKGLGADLVDSYAQKRYNERREGTDPDWPHKMSHISIYEDFQPAWKREMGQQLREKYESGEES